MKVHEFEEKNLIADRTVIAFNSKYAQKIKFLDYTTHRKRKVLGLLKYLSIDGLRPSTKPFTTKKSLSISDIYMATSIILMVKVDNIREEDTMPLETFLKAQQIISSGASKALLSRAYY